MTDFCLLLYFFLYIFFCGYQPDKNKSQPVKSIDYNLSSPDKILVLPHLLHEISGITEIDATSIACIQDEHGILYIYDIVKNQIIKQFYFSYDGDYEGVARVDKTLYILRSDGMLFGIVNYESGNFKRVSYSTGTPTKDNEGLCYDKKNNRLLIAPKDNPWKESENKDLREIYSFDLSTKKLTKNPAFEFDLSLIERFALDNKIKVPMKSNKKGNEKKPDIKFRTSAIAIHPLTNKLFVVSANEHLLYVFDMNGNIEYLERLDPDMFNQPEGITFLKNGDMLISNEGQDKNPTLLRFNYKKPKVASIVGCTPS
jgi:hypothetical protein